MDDATIRAFAPKAAILSGGPASTTEADAPRRRRPCWSLAAVAAMVDDLIRQVHALDAVANSGLDLRRHKVPTGS